MAKAKNAPVSLAMEDDETKLTPEEEAELVKEEKDVSALEQPQEGAPETSPKEVKGEKHEKFIPYERFQETIRQRDAAAQKAQENEAYRERWARLEERQKAAQEKEQERQAQEAAEKAAAERPDPAIDPVGARVWDADQRSLRLEQQLQQVVQQFTGVAQQNQVALQNQELATWVTGQVGVARTRVSDYDARVDYARDQRTQWWGQFYPAEQAKQIVAEEERALLERARMIGMPLSDMVTALSTQWGYQGQNGAASQNGNGQARQAAPAQVLPSANQKIDQIQRGQAMQGLGRIQSGEVQQNRQWASMSNEEFKAYVANMSDDDYLEHVQDSQTGKQFNARVSQVDLA